MNNPLEKNYSLTATITAVLGLLSSIGYCFATGVFLKLKPLMTHFESTADYEQYLPFVGLVWVVGILFHGAAFLLLLTRMLKETKLLFSMSLLFVLNVLSSILLLANLPLINDILNQYQHHLSQPEWTLLFLTHSLHLLFTLWMSGSLLGWRSLFQKQNYRERVLKDEVLFSTALNVGLISGLAGITMITGFYFLNIPDWILQRAIPVITLLLLTPTAGIVAIWLISHLKEGLAQWYDEKQFSDVSRAGLITLTTAIPLLLIWYALQLASGITYYGLLWFPLFAFYSLAVFSVTSLYLYRYR